MIIMIALAVIVSVMGFIVGRMDNINTGVKPSIREGIYVAGGALGSLGVGSFVIWMIVWLWSMSLNTQSSWIDMSFWLAYSLVAAAIGGLVMGATKPR